MKIKGKHNATLEEKMEILEGIVAYDYRNIRNHKNYD